MPIYLRRFYLKRLQKQYKEENDAIKKAQQKVRRPKFKK
jgi:hypothetical protein|tara:strand:- start:523 stop:639 length:117 start_codon:yes stop_codon:yes gene_type:complete